MEWIRSKTLSQWPLFLKEHRVQGNYDIASSGFSVIPLSHSRKFICFISSIVYRVHLVTMCHFFRDPTKSSYRL